MTVVREGARMRMRNAGWLVTIGVGLVTGGVVEAGPGTHTVTVSLNYDFSADAACSATVTKGCLQQFNIYDVTTGTPVKLFSVAAPAGAERGGDGDHRDERGAHVEERSPYVWGYGADGRWDGVKPKRVYCYCDNAPRFACKL